MVMQRTIQESVVRDIIITTCDECGKEIGRNRNHDYEGRPCSLCSRHFCHKCAKKVLKKIDKMYLTICPTCQKVDNGTIEKMMVLLDKSESLNDKRYRMHEAWATRSKAIHLSIANRTESEPSTPTSR
jgi:hypothetical protein